MKFLLTVFAALLCVNVNVNVNAAAPSLNNYFDLTAGGAYTGCGNWQSKFTYPAYTNYTTTPATFYVDPTNQVFSVQVTDYANQYVTANGFYATIAKFPGKCFFEPYNFTRLSTAYEEAFSTDYGYFDKTYFGLVRDAVACANYEAIEFYTRTTHYPSTVERLTLFTYHLPSYSPQIGAPSKFLGLFQVSSIIDGVDTSKTALPAECLAANLTSYCDSFFPPGNYTLYY